MRLYHDIRVADLSKAREVIVTVTKSRVQVNVMFSLEHYVTFETEVKDVDDKTMEQYLTKEIAEQWERNVAYELNQFIEFVKRRIEREKR